MARLVNARASRRGVRTRGAGLVQRAVGGSGSRASFARRFAQSARRRLLPELRRRTPVDTGKLRRSLKVVQRGSRVVLQGLGYGRQVGTPRTAMQVYRVNSRAIARDTAGR